MAFTVEDGTGVAGANAYCTVAFYKAHQKDRGVAVTQGGGEIEVAIVKATTYMESRWRFVGVRKTAAQGAHFPASHGFYWDGRVVPNDEVPIEVQESCADYTLIALTEELAPAPTFDDSNAIITKRREKAAVVEEEYEFGGGGTPRTFRKYPIPDRRLMNAGLVVNGNAMLRV